MDMQRNVGNSIVFSLNAFVWDAGGVDIVTFTYYPFCFPYSNKLKFIFAFFSHFLKIDK